MTPTENKNEELRSELSRTLIMGARNLEFVARVISNRNPFKKQEAMMNIERTLKNIMSFCEELIEEAE